MDPPSPPKKAISKSILKRFTQPHHGSSRRPIKHEPMCLEIRKSKFPIFCFMCMLSLPFILVFITSTNRYAGSRILAPLESYHVPSDSRLCSGISVSTQTSYAQFYIFEEEPPLTEVISDQFNRSFVLNPLTYKNWYWSLFNQSHINMYICAEDPQLQYLVIRGDSNFTNWKDNPSSFDPQQYYFSTIITTPCIYDKKKAFGI